MPVRLTLATVSTPGAIAIIQLHGDGAAAMLRAITGQSEFAVSRLRYVPIAEIDSGVAVLLRDDWAQLMPHGGPRVVRRIIEALIAQGCVFDDADAATARSLYPEAASALEADVLATIARAASPMAIDLLLQQPERWTKFLRGSESRAEEDDAAVMDEILARSRVLDRLIAPPGVVVIGQPNVGKSTLTNRMLGRAASIVADLPGTTRDWVAGLAELPPGVAVRWMDTPGLRGSDDAIEQRAIALANQVIREADVLIVMRDPAIDWPDEASLPRWPDLWVMNKCDLAQEASVQRDGDGHSAQSPRAISADTGQGIDALQRDIVKKLGLGAVSDLELWAFTERLREILTNRDWAALTDYTAGLTSSAR